LFLKCDNKQFILTLCKEQTVEDQHQANILEYSCQKNDNAVRNSEFNQIPMKRDDDDMGVHGYNEGT
jgi:hypothetical protein